jgi:SPP1 gp7 family putative phage head morphogenesis protein
MPSAESIAARRRTVERAQKRRPKQTNKIVELREPRNVQLAYQKELTKLVDEFSDLVREVLIEALPELEVENNLTIPEGARQDALGDDLEKLTELLGSKARAIFAVARIKSIAQRIAADAFSFNKKAVEDQLIDAVGIKLPLDEPFIADQFEMFVQSQVSLVTKLQEEQLKTIESVVLQGFREGQRHEMIAEQIEERLGVTKSRALLIARDQIAKINGELVRLRHTNIGITQYRWVTSRDERVRSSHRERHGKVFSWDNPPPDGHPGQPINCRCTASPVVD